ncbi:MAG TPA: PEP-CTERM sorting domain-containing protein [Isosphaeraceae bacterium]
MRRYSLVLAALALAATAPASKAAFIDFVALPAGHADAVTIGPTTLAGVDFGIASIVGEGTPQHDGSGPAFSGGRLDFTTGAYTGTDAAGDLMYGPGGTLTISDSAGTLFSGQFTGTTTLVPETGGLFKILVAGFAGQVNAGLNSFFGLSTGDSSAGTLSLNFASSSTGLTFLSGDISIDPNPQGPPIGVPEPASLALIALGLPVALVARRRARKNAA